MLSLDGLDAAARQLPIVKLIFAQLHALGFGHGEFVSDERGSLFDGIITGKLQNDPPRLKPVLFERERRTLAVGRDRD